MEFSNFKSVNLKINALLYELNERETIHLSQDFRRVWRLTDKQLEALELYGIIKIQKSCLQTSSTINVNYTYISKGMNFPCVIPNNIEEQKFVKDKKRHLKEEYVRRKVEPYVAREILKSLVDSCDWGKGDDIDRLASIKYSHITGRLYYPYNNMRRMERLKIPNWQFVTIDAGASQLVILANDIEKICPGNKFSDVVLNASDVYESLKPYVDANGYKNWMKKLENGSTEEQDMFNKLNETFFDQEFDGRLLPRRAMKLMMYRIVFGGQVSLLKGFEELKSHVDFLQGNYMHSISKRYRLSNRAGYNYLKNIASMMSHREAKVIRDIAMRMSLSSIKYQIVHDAFDVEKDKVADALEICKKVANDNILKNYIFSQKDSIVSKLI